MGFRNRLWLAGADGRMNLSVPIADGRNEKQLYKDVRIVPGRWQVIHFRAIVSCYNRSPWFEHYRDELAVLYERNFDFLFDWNLACYEWMSGHLEIEPPVLVDRAMDDADRCDDFTNFFHPSTEANWLNEGTAGGVAIARYPQVFEERTGFVPGLSILDLLFCEGPRAAAFLE